MEYQSFLSEQGLTQRDNEWLSARLDHIWALLYSDVERLNRVHVRFKGRWKNKFGHIKRVKDDTEIVVNSLLKDPQVPEFLIDITLAHELAHYAHGFNSPHKRKYKHPHAGGVVTKELQRRGFGHMLRLEKDYIRKQWPHFVRSKLT